MPEWDDERGSQSSGEEGEEEEGREDEEDDGDVSLRCGVKS